MVTTMILRDRGVVDLWWVEAVSLHAVDFYHSIGSWMAVSALWILARLMTSIGGLVCLTVPNETDPNCK
jgi:hypothetical protein